MVNYSRTNLKVLKTSCLAILLFLVLIINSGCTQTPSFRQMTPLPDPKGFGGMYAATIGDTLITAGGSNFPEKPAWEDGEKVWYDNIYSYDEKNNQWHLLEEKLPIPLGYGGYGSGGNWAVFLGGYNEKGPTNKVWKLKYINNELVFEELPPMPKSCLYFNSVINNGILYVMGGLEKPDSARAMKNFWALDMNAEGDQLKWQRLGSWPGPARHLSVSASVGAKIYLFSGIELNADPSTGEKQLNYLKDGYCYDTIKRKWTELPDMPRATAAAPQPAIAQKDMIYILGGTDGTLRKHKPQNYPPFKKEIFCYNTKSFQWSQCGNMETTRITAATAEWHGGYAIINGEIRPCKRTPEVLFVSVND
jgi:N-acetylneuraminate epimerase